MSQQLSSPATVHNCLKTHRPARNEVADDIAKAATSNPVDPEDHMVLTSTEIYFRTKELTCRTWSVGVITQKQECLYRTPHTPSRSDFCPFLVVSSQRVI
ncbi:hypothetical protein TNCV_232561 [Trichonephila clavipes]|nr:hypothetical protein TNCV_232561 [Trichonephila clavipes]